MEYKLKVKLVASGKKEDSTYKNIVNPYDSNIICMIFDDLESYGIPMEKHCRKYITEKNKQFPL